VGDIEDVARAALPRLGRGQVDHRRRAARRRGYRRAV